jgi:hypothetical protein
VAAAPAPPPPAATTWRWSPARPRAAPSSRPPPAS